jgi:hypothetical protein
VDGIIKTSCATRDADTLRQLDEHAGYLKELLAKYAIKGFPTSLAKLKINDLVLAGDLAGCYRLLSEVQGLGLLLSESIFTATTYRRLIEATKDKKMIASCLQAVQEIQDKQPARIEFALNYYDVIALAHEKLKDRDAARKATEEYNRRDEIKKEYAKNLFQKKDGE